MKFLLALLMAVLAVSSEARPSQDRVKNAVKKAREITTAQRENNGRFQRLNGNAPSCSHMLRMTRVLDDQTASNRANVLLMTSRLLMEEGFSMSDLHNPEVASEVTSQLNFDHVSATCDPNTPYRKWDGSCNNLANPEWGMAGIEQKRVLPSAYADGLGRPRAFSVNGMPLPNPRTVSNVVHKVDKKPEKSKTDTLQLMAFGQFLDHDIVLTPHADAADCCSANTNEECFPLTVEQDDDTFSAGYCMDVSRSAAFSSSNVLGVRQQGNGITSYIDASNVYGSSDVEITSLMQADEGLLRTASPNRLPNNPDSECRITNQSHSCSLAGDVRVNEVPTLTSYHTLFVREHNRIASELGKNITDPDVLFQETRRILIAEFQHIVYNEFLPAILSPQAMATYGLEGGQYIYDSDVDATIANSFGIAYRFGHTWIPNEMNLFKQMLNPLKLGMMEDNFFDPALTYEPEGIEKLAYWLSGDMIQKTDRVVDRAARDLLFLDDQGDSFDLAALNIHRGRDHGLPSYYNFRQWCGLPDADSFTTNPGGLVDHDDDIVARLASVYDDPRDIDLWTGALTERAIDGGMVGPTLECILGRQFGALKTGDRFWYEGEAAKFSSEQLSEIRSVSLAKVLCDNMNFDKIQEDAFRVRSRKTKCSDIKGLDLAKFAF